MANYKKENKILVTSFIMTVFLLVNYVPRSKMREAQVAFLFQQVITWVFGLFVVEKGFITYPYRAFFKKSCKSSFFFEYFVYPSITVLFNLYFPEKRNCLCKIIYVSFYSGIITFSEIFIERYTKLIHYVKWSSFTSFLTLAITLYVSRLYYRWFFYKV
jgi:hypothetical protein